MITHKFRVKLLLKVRGVGLYGVKFLGKKIKVWSRDYNNETVLFILVYIIKLGHVITMINLNIKNTKFCYMCA